MHASTTSLVAFLALSVPALAKKSCHANNVAHCCDKLSEEFPDQVVTSSSSSYSDWNHRWADTAELAPSCIFRPKSTEDVSAALKVLSTGRGGKNDYCPFSLVAGGHTPWAGLNNIDGGVALELSQLNSAVLADDRSHVKLGAGARWHDTYEEMNGKGIAYPGGRCPDVGIAGLTLGGGYSWFSGQVGFVADSVINYEVVLADGDIVNANASSNSDLFKALKGGSNNFGVVTRFDIKAFEHDQQVQGGLIILPESSTDEVLSALQNFTDDATGVHPTAGLTIEYFLDNANAPGEGQILVWLIDTDASTESEALAPFHQMEPKLVDLYYRSSSIADYPSSIPEVSRVLMADATFVNDFQALKAVYDVTMEIKASLSHVPDLIWDFQFEPLPRHLLDASKANGGNIMGLDNVEEDLMVIFIMPLWQDVQYDAEIAKAAEKWYKEVQRITKKMGKSHPWEFANYAAGFQNVIGSYGPENVKFLKQVAKKYDPKGLFQKAVPGGYKLEKSQSAKLRL